MTQEHKQLLLQDLSTRLPYRVKVQYISKLGEVIVKELRGSDIEVLYDGYYPERYKPYLRPMSSMTEEEKWEFIDATDGELRYSEVFDVIKPMDESEDYCASFVSYLKAIDWLNKKHFDYRGLIEKGLALEAPEGMYNVK